MAKRQTRRSISFNVAIYDAVVAEAARRKLPASHYVELLVRKATTFAAELRRRGWLAPEREGYAPGSWGAL